MANGVVAHFHLSFHQFWMDVVIVPIYQGVVHENHQSNFFFFKFGVVESFANQLLHFVVDAQHGLLYAFVKYIFPR